MSLFNQLSTWLPAQMKAAAGVSVTYSRPGQTSLTLTAWVGRVAFRSQAKGVRIEFGDRDYLLKAADLTYGTPRVGDRITETIGGTSTIFEVQTPDNGEAAWPYSDPARSVYRLHCKRVKPSLGTDAPVLVSATVAANGTTLTLVFDQRMTATSWSGFALSGTFGASTPTYVSGDLGNTVVFTLSRTVGVTETVTIAYVPGVVKNLTADALAAFSGTAVTNNSTQAGGWNPSGVSGLKVWVKAGPTWNFTDAAGTVAAGNGDLVYTATDRSTGGFTVQQATAADRPALRLTGSTYDLRGVTDDYLDASGSTALNGLTAFTVFLSGIADGAPADLDTIWGWGNGGELGIIRADGVNWTAVAWINGAARTVTSTTAIPVGSRFVIGLVIDTSLGSAQAKLYSGGTLIGSTTQAGALDTTAAATKRILSDAFAASRGWTGGIHEAIVLNRAPVNAAELAAIAAYLATS